MTAEVHRRLGGRYRLPQVRRVGSLHDRSFAERNLRIRQTEEAVARAAAAVAAERAAWEAEAVAVCEPFGLDWRDMANLQALDLLALIEVVDGPHWRWMGRTNNGGLAVVRSRTIEAARWNTERSAAKLVHGLLVSDHEPPGQSRARCGAEFICLLPAHRCPVCAGVLA